MLRYEGKSAAEISEMVGLSKERIAQLFCEFRKQGIEEYTRKKYGGNHRNLSYEEEEEILKQFDKKAEEEHINIARDIKKVFDERLGTDTARGYSLIIMKTFVDDILPK